MKLIRFGNKGDEKPGFIDNNNLRRDISTLFKDWDKSFFENNGLNIAERYIKNSSKFPIVPDNIRWASCIARPGKVICAGLNYIDHASESKMEVPTEPIIFQKGANTVVGPYDNIIIPKGSEKTDWEVELGVVIGKEARYLDKIEDSKKYIAGYCIANDVSERAFQLEKGGQWTKGKSCDNFCPIGPFMLTADEIANINNLNLELYVNSKRMQRGNTSDMIFNVFFLVHYLSQFMTLEAGDLILTGTPPGVGFGMNPPMYLKKGDVVELSVEGLGNQKQVCIQA